MLGAACCDSDDEAAASSFKRKPAPMGAMNVVVVVIDSLRVDHVYGPRARTPAMNNVAKQALRFTRAYPEGMPTIPARRAIMAGRRTYPFRGWRPYRELPPQPGWEPVGSDGKMWAEVLRENGWTTGYVTDNPHMLLGVHKRFRRRFDRVELVDGQVPLRSKPKRKVSQAQMSRHLPPTLRNSRAEPRMAAYLAANPRSRREEDFLSARVFRKGMNWIEWARTRQPFALTIDSLRRPRALGRPAPHQGHLRRTQRGARADPALSRPRPPSTARSSSAAPCSPACASSTPPRSRSSTPGWGTSWTGWPTSAWPRTRWWWCSATTACCSASTAGWASATTRSTRSSRTCRS